MAIKRLFGQIALLMVFFLLTTHHLHAQKILEGMNGNWISSEEQVRIVSSQVAYDLNSPKGAVVLSKFQIEKEAQLYLVNTLKDEIAVQFQLPVPQRLDSWFSGMFYYPIDFTTFNQNGTFRLELKTGGQFFASANFEIGEKAIARSTIPEIVGFYNHQRANSPEELGADKALKLFGSDRTVDLTGGWCDASGDVSKYFSHLAYTNFMSPQQTPLVVWSMINTLETCSDLLSEIGAVDKLLEETLYGADYLMKSLDPEGYFYMTVFSYFDKDPSARRVVGLLADSKTTSDYQCAYREGAGMAIADLARLSNNKLVNTELRVKFLAAAEKAFAHSQKFNLNYCDDGKENIIDDYCALMGSTELWLATDKAIYRDEARKRAQNLSKRISTDGYFIANDSNRPFWHASDAGLPIIALARYLDKEAEPNFRSSALSTIKKALDYNLAVTSKVENPFGYARQNFLLNGKVMDGFFIPHENESGWWWQGENARLGSLAAAALVGSRLVYPKEKFPEQNDALMQFAYHQLTWVLGRNPFDICFMYQKGKNNVPYMKSMYGHGTGKGGISNGITGNKEKPDGSGIDFRFEDDGNEWRWTEQWIPHSAWFLQGVAATVSE